MIEGRSIPVEVDFSEPIANYNDLGLDRIRLVVSDVYAVPVGRRQLLRNKNATQMP